MDDSVNVSHSNVSYTETQLWGKVIKQEKGCESSKSNKEQGKEHVRTTPYFNRWLFVCFSFYIFTLTIHNGACCIHI